MIISAADQIKYPQFTKYVRLAIPKLVKIPKIVSNVATYGSISSSEFSDAVTWNKGPNIKITDLHQGQCGVPKAYGCFRTSTPNTLEIHIGTVKNFEHANASHADKNSSGKMVYVVGATLIHELCHWGNHNNVPPVPEIREMGAEFERNTYGKIIY